MNAVATDAGIATSGRSGFVRYVAQQRRVTPQEVFRRLKVMGGFLVLGTLGATAALMLIGLGVPASEPARLLTAFGFIAAIAVCFATFFSASLLLWGAFLSQYVATLDATSELMDAREENETVVLAEAAAPAAVAPADANATAEVAVQENNAVVEGFAEEAAALVEAITLAMGDRQPAVLQDMHKELDLMRARIKELQQGMSPIDQVRMYSVLRNHTHLGSYARRKKKAAAEEVQRQVELLEMAGLRTR